MRANRRAPTQSTGGAYQTVGRGGAEAAAGCMARADSGRAHTPSKRVITTQTKTGITTVNAAFRNASSLGHLIGRARWHTEQR